jgi:hypothetical protein
MIIRAKKGYDRIKEAQKIHEKKILERITAEGSYEPSYLCGIPIYNALDRLKAKGIIRYSKAEQGYIIT